MKKYNRIFVFIFVAIISSGPTVSAQQGSPGEDTAAQKPDLSHLLPETTYKFSIGSDEHLTISAPGFKETSLIPITGEYTGTKVLNPIQPDIKHLQFEGHVNYDNNISYSALFGPVNSDFKWGFHYSDSLFEATLDTAKADSYRVESIDIYPYSTNDDTCYSYYAGTWVKDTVNLNWDWGLNWDKDRFIKKLDSLESESCRITDIEYDILNQKFGAVWIKDNKGWDYVVDLDVDIFKQQAEKQYSVGRRPIDFQIYLNESRTDFLYAGVWVDVDTTEVKVDTTGGKDSTEVKFDRSRWAVNCTESEFLSLANDYDKDNYRLIDYEAYKTSDGPMYAGIWVNDGQAGGYLLNYTDLYSFLSELYIFSENSFRPVCFDIFSDTLFIHTPYIGIELNEPTTIKTYNLAQNYPNPFNSKTTIEFEIAEDAFVTVKVYNILGNEVASLVKEKFFAGRYQTRFNAEKLSSGIYFYRLEAIGKTTFIQTKKMSLLK